MSKEKDKDKDEKEGKLSLVRNSKLRQTDDDQSLDELSPDRRNGPAALQPTTGPPIIIRSGIGIPETKASENIRSEMVNNDLDLSHANVPHHTVEDKTEKPIKALPAVRVPEKNSSTNMTPQTQAAGHVMLIPATQPPSHRSSSPQPSSNTSPPVSAAIAPQPAAGQQPTLPTSLCPPALRERGYEITEEIGGGAFSRVYRARYKMMADKEIAVKIIALDKVPEVWRDKCLRQELRIVRKLQHPHIIKVWDIIKTRRNVFIFMDLAENNSVLHYMQQSGKPIQENIARIWFTQVTGAMCYMHSKGIAHRDLKNENILLDRDHNAKLTDFGFACYAVDQNTRQPIYSPTCCGTIAYIAPEVLNPPYEARTADIWSLGVCLFEMITFHKPFEDTGNHRKLLKLQLQRNYHFPPNLEAKIPEELKDLIHRMIEPDVDQRLTAMQILQHPWIVLGFGVKS